MTAPASVIQELHDLIDALDTDQAVRALAMIGLMTDDGDLTPEEISELEEGIAAAERGETISGDQLERELGIDL